MDAKRFVQAILNAILHGGKVVNISATNCLVQRAAHIALNFSGDERKMLMEGVKDGMAASQKMGHIKELDRLKERIESEAAARGENPRVDVNEQGDAAVISHAAVIASSSGSSSGGSSASSGSSSSGSAQVSEA